MTKNNNPPMESHQRWSVDKELNSQNQCSTCNGNVRTTNGLVEATYPALKCTFSAALSDLVYPS